MFEAGIRAYPPTVRRRRMTGGKEGIQWLAFRRDDCGPAARNAEQNCGTMDHNHRNRTQMMEKNA